MHGSYKVTALLPSHFVPGILRIPTTELLRAPRGYAILIGLALIGDVVIASTLPLGVLWILSALLHVAGIPILGVAITIGVVITAFIFTVKLERLEMRSEIHAIIMLGGKLYVFNNGKGGICVSMDLASRCQDKSIQSTYIVTVSGCKFWIPATMREIGTSAYRPAAQPLSYAVLTKRCAQSPNAT